MKQIIHFDSQLQETIFKLEVTCEKLCKTIYEKYQPEFEPFGQHLIIELIRTRKGNGEEEVDFFEKDYESFIEIGIEQEDEYFPNGYIPLWKCKEEWFQKTGYLTIKNETEIYGIIQAMVKEMLEEKEIG